MMKILKKIITLGALLILFFGLISVYKNLTSVAIIQAQVSTPTPSPSASTSASPSASTAAGTGTTSGSGEQEGGCGEADSTCPTPNPLTPWGGDQSQSLSESLKQSNITTAWGLTLDLINVIAIFVLLAIAFANILHLGERDEYNFKRLIPALVIGLILANFSHLICRAIIDFAAMLMNFFVPKNETMNVSFNLILGMWSGFVKNLGWGSAAGVGGGIVLLVSFMFLGLGCVIIPIAAILLLIPAIIIFVVSVMLAVRVYIIWFLVIVSPVAFFAIMFSVFQKQIQWWWTWFFQWVFMGPIVYFMIYIAEGFARSDVFQDSGGTLPCLDLAAGQQVDGFTKYLFVNALLVLAIIVPYMMGKSIFAPLWKYVGQHAAKAGAYGAGSMLQAGVRAQGFLTKNTLGKIPIIGKPFKAIGEKMANAPHALTFAQGIGGYLEGKQKADTEAYTTRVQQGVAKVPLLRAANKNLDIEFGKKNGQTIAQNNNPWEAGIFRYDAQGNPMGDNIENAHGNAGANMLGMGKEHANIIGYRMQRLRELTGAGNQLKVEHAYKYATEKGKRENNIIKAAGRAGHKIDRKDVDSAFKQIDREVADIHAGKTVNLGGGRLATSERVRNGTALDGMTTRAPGGGMDADLRYGNIGVAQGRTQSP